ncbi:class IV lanthionine synthetase LanL [Kitasatospora camelliae]|uniref:Class IV lanthionine synthetase LanL n=1 Tax=Kitasatospora camelliae TaxID=3156397 RepID=A0AAU8K0C1_9ACTN
MPRTHPADRPAFTPPPWAVTPFPDLDLGADADPGPQPARATAVLLHDRYEVRTALRHSYRGGVYRGTDRRTGREVLVKEARPHVGAALDGTDATDLLRHEAAAHDRLAEAGLAPRTLDLFEQGGNLYLVRDHVPGTDLRRRTEPVGDPALPALIERLADLVLRVHDLGLVLRDLHPGNVIATPDGDLRLIDLEAAARPGDPVRTVRTEGYTAPETAGAGPLAPAPGPEADLYGLGAVLFHLLTGAEPALAPDRPALRGSEERHAALLAGALADRPALRPYQAVVLGLMAEDPRRRWTADRLRARLARLRGTPATAAAPVAEGRVPGEPVDTVAERLLADGLTWLLATMTPDHPDRLWAPGESGRRTDPLNLQHGAAGVLGVLTAAARHRPDPRLREAVATAARWIGDRAEGSGQPLPGLYFGRSGTAWALLDAARLLDDDALADRALRLAREIPLDGPIPEVCHGTAGAGLAQLHAWHSTGDPGYRQRVLTAADRLLARAARGRSGVLWPVPPTADSALAGATHLGFGHGVAGVGTFLLLAGLATGREDLLAAARHAGDTLLRSAVRRDGAADWPVDDRRAGAPPHAPQWCSGAAGIGTFLIRLWQATGDPRHREAAEQAAVSVHRWRHRLSPAACHGLAGNAEFLLDLADATGDGEHRRRAADLVACAHARYVVHDGLHLVPDETQTRVHAAYNTGLSGLLGLLTRLRYGGTRLWLPTGEHPADQGRR